MASSAGGSLPHRTISNIRTGESNSPSRPQATPGSPHTPQRTITSTFGSPSSIRAEEDVILIEFGARKLHVGFGGDPVPKGQLEFGPEHQRRVGDFRAWETGYQDDWRRRPLGKDWGSDHELWQFDIRGVDMGLVQDKIERALREAFTKFLLIDSRARRMVVVLPSGIPMPLLSATLDTLFTRFQTPSISLLSSPVMSAVAAGARSALVVDLGWRETVVTSVYEYREVQCNRSVRAGKLLLESVHHFLSAAIAKSQGKSYQPSSDPDAEHLLGFEECEEIASRMLWCRPMRGAAASQDTVGLPTVTEQDESESTAAAVNQTTSIPLKSVSSPAALDIPYEQLAEPCENTFFESQLASTSFDDHELPLPMLVYRSLLQLPVDVRSVCMARIIFTGGCSRILGLRGRIFDEVNLLVKERGWDPVRGKGVEQLKANPKLQRRGSRQASNGPTGVSQPPDSGSEQDGVWHDAANAGPEVDPIDEQLRKGSDARPPVQGELRAIESLGAWSGASLLSQLKIPAIATVDREIWLQQGAAGASRPGEVDVKVQQRQSMGAGGLIRGAASGTNWTLGVWGSS